MGADSSAENTQNAPEFICPICLPKPKSSEFQWKKALLGVRSLWCKHIKLVYKNETIHLEYIYLFFGYKFGELQQYFSPNWGWKTFGYPIFHCVWQGIFKLQRHSIRRTSRKFSFKPADSCGESRALESKNILCVWQGIFKFQSMEDGGVDRIVINCRQNQVGQMADFPPLLTL